MKYRWDRKYLQWGVTAFCVIACSIIFYSVINQWSAVHRVIDRINDLLSPMIIGLIIAYILNPVLSFAENKLMIPLGKRIYPRDDKKARVFARSTGVALVVLLVLILFALIIVCVVPQLYFSVQRLVHKMQDYYNITLSWIYGFLNQSAGTETLFSSVLLRAKDYFINWVNTGLLPRLQEIVIGVSSGVLVLIRSIFDFFVGLVLSIYVMYRKEEFVAKFKKLAYSLMSKRVTDSLIRAVGHVHKTFGQYIVGKIINSVLMSLICAVFMVAFRMPYAALISVIIGVTDMIPFFGPYIGSIPCIMLVLLEDPFKCAIFTVFVLILHAFNGNIMEPKIIGTSTGMSGFWVLSSILFFGGLFGVLGMLCGVPVFAVIYSGIGTWSRHRLKEKNLPTDTADFEKQGPISIKGKEE